MNQIPKTIGLLLMGVSLFAQPALFGPRVDIGGIPNAACSVIFDANGDGRPDIAVGAANSVYLLVQSPGPVGTFANRGAVITTAAGTSVTAVAAADFNGDNKQDLLVATTSSLGSVQLYLGNGDGTFQAPSSVTGHNNYVTLGIADFNNDHKPDFAVSTGAGVFVYIGDGTGAFPTIKVLSAQSAGPPLAIGDFNHDGKPDVAYGTGVYLGNGDGTLGIPTGGPFYSRSSALANFLSPILLAVSDVNNDGRPDIGAVEFSGELGVFTGNGDGTFQPAVLQSLPFPNGFALSDINSDGRPDVVALTAGSPGSLNIFPGTGGGQFQTIPVSFPACTALQNAQNTPNAITIGDLNGDGAPDVIAVCGTGNTVSIFLSVAPSVFLQSAANPSAPGQTVQVTALVGSPGLGFIYTTGYSVQFYDGSTALGTPTPISNGLVVRPLSSLAQGIHFLTAVLLNAQNAAVATSGIVSQIVSANSCAANVSAQLQISPGGFRRNPTTLQWAQTVTITNTSGTAIAGPLSLALNSLTNGVTALNTAGVTSCSSPAGAPLVDTGLCPGASLPAGQSISVSLAFTNPSNKPISYTPAPLAGYAPR